MFSCLCVVCVCVCRFLLQSYSPWFFISALVSSYLVIYFDLYYYVSFAGTKLTVEEAIAVHVYTQVLFSCSTSLLFLKLACAISESILERCRVGSQ